jgi:hypothetical protein
MLARMWIKGTFIYCWWECKLVITTMKSSMEALQKTKSRNVIHPAIPFLAICLKECKTVYNKGTRTAMFIAALFSIAKLWNQPRGLTTDEWIKKM